MNNIFIGVKPSVISVLLITITLVAIWHSQLFWQSYQAYFSLFFQVAALVTIIFATQFNQHRFALLTAFLLLLSVLPELESEHLNYWQQNNTWQLLTISCCFAYLACIKDRSLFSVHFLYRLLGFAGCLAISYSWLMFVDWLSLYDKSYQTITDHWLFIYLPIVLTSLIILYQSITSSLLVQSAILITSVLLLCSAMEGDLLSWQVISIVLVLYYLLSVITSSYFLAYRDELTGLPSRRALFQTALSLGRKYSVAMMDIDHFKKFNDTYGHDIGDQVLKLVATQLAKVKSGGRVFRYGGEEFTVIFPRKQAEQTLQELETLRQAIADYQMVIRQPVRVGKDGRKMKKSANTKSVSVTISIGVATRLPKQNFEQVMKAADKKLYQAKKNGRNNVTS